MHTEVSTGPGRPFRVLVVEDDVQARGFFEQSVRASERLRWMAGLGTVRDALA